MDATRLAVEAVKAVTVHLRRRLSPAEHLVVVDLPNGGAIKYYERKGFLAELQDHPSDERVLKPLIEGLCKRYPERVPVLVILTEDKIEVVAVTYGDN